MLGAIAEGPTHGFAVARLLAPGGALGAIWTVSRPDVYLALHKLQQLGLVECRATEPGERGPERTVLAAAPAGKRLLSRWLASPVDHVRDVRSLLLLKLALIDRAGRNPAALIAAQRARLEKLLTALEARSAGSVGFEDVLVDWRLTSCRGALDFLARREQRAAVRPEAKHGRPARCRVVES